MVPNEHVENLLCYLIKAELLQEGTFFLIHLFARAVLVMKRLDIQTLIPLLLYQF